jgi:sulfur transfer protein SufE
MRSSKTSAKLGQVKEPEAIANAARNVKLTAARSNSLAALSRAIRQKLDDMVAQETQRIAATLGVV